MWNHLIQLISHLCICGFLSVYWRGKNVLFIDTILCCAWKVAVFINVFMQKSKRDVNCSFPLLFLMSFWSLQTKWACILPLYNALKFSAVVYEYSTQCLDGFEFLFLSWNSLWIILPSWLSLCLSAKREKSLIFAEWCARAKHKANEVNHSKRSFS